jgi:hypothetical protein
MAARRVAAPDTAETELLLRPSICPVIALLLSVFNSPELLPSEHLPFC